MIDSVLTLMQIMPMDLPGDPGSVAPPGIGERVSTLLSWAKWGSFAVAIVAIMFLAARAAIAHRQGQGFGDMGGVGIALIAVVIIASAFGVVGALQ